jgi:hypothetical protein
LNQEQAVIAWGIQKIPGGRDGDSICASLKKVAMMPPVSISVGDDR